MSGIIEVNMFDKEVDSKDHPVADSFRALLEDVAEQFGCSLTFFDVKKGVASFSFDKEELTADILKILKDGDKEIS